MSETHTKKLRTPAQYERERADTIRALRSLCSLYGDSHWEDTLHMADIVEKHLGRDLEYRLQLMKAQAVEEVLKRIEKANTDNFSFGTPEGVNDDPTISHEVAEEIYLIRSSNRAIVWTEP